MKGIAYFSMEFGLSEGLPLYSGGLGILAGDYMKSASDLGLPVTGVGLLYQEGYFRQAIDAEGRQIELYPYNDPVSLPIQPVLSDGAWLRIAIQLPGRPLHLRVWRACVGKLNLYLLDSNDPLNAPADRSITSRLYGGSQEQRLQQELVLGIGGWRALEAVKAPVDVCHLNEGHAAFVVLERARAHMREHKTTFWEGLWATRPGNLFTTHTPVEAGFDRFERILIGKYLSEYLAEMGAGAPPLEEVLALGRKDGSHASEPLNMAYLAMRGCAWANGVSKLHGTVSRTLFRHLYPRWPEREVPVGSVTNGVHLPSWIAESAPALEQSDEELMRTRASDRNRLVEFARAGLVRQLAQRGSKPVDNPDSILAPDALTLGFSRRFAEYKRPTLLLRDPERFARILLNADRPVQIVIAGKAHPADQTGKGLIEEWIKFIHERGVRHRAVFLEDYDIDLTEHLVQGVDVWINTPRRPWEASGTSGMKVLGNGGLNLSELDGWWAEAYTPDVGWALGDGHEHPGSSQDAIEAEQLYQLLEGEVIPSFYDRDSQGLSVSWVKRIRASMMQLVQQFSSERMCREYFANYYLGAAGAVRRRSDTTKALLDWQDLLNQHWVELRFGSFETWHDQDRLRFRIEVLLGKVPPEAVRVEIYADPQGNGSAFRQEMEKKEGNLYESFAPDSRSVSDYSVRVIPHHREAFVPSEESHILWRG